MATAYAVEHLVRYGKASGVRIAGLICIAEESPGLVIGHVEVVELEATAAESAESIILIFGITHPPAFSRQTEILECSRLKNRSSLLCNKIRGCYCSHHD